MAVLNLTKSTTVAQLKKEFNETFGAVLRIYSGRSQAEETTTLGELGLSNEGTFECRSSLTVVRFIKRMQNEFGLKVKVYTCDDWVAALDGLTLESAGKVKKNAVKADMESMIAYQRTEEVEVAPEEKNIAIKKSASYGEYIINIAEDNKVIVLKNGVECDNSKTALREIASSISFTIDPKWNTRQVGAKVVDALNGDFSVEPKEDGAFIEITPDTIIDDIYVAFTLKYPHLHLRFVTESGVMNALVDSKKTVALVRKDFNKKLGEDYQFESGKVSIEEDVVIEDLTDHFRAYGLCSPWVCCHYGDDLEPEPHGDDRTLGFANNDSAPDEIYMIAGKRKIDAYGNILSKIDSVRIEIEYTEYEYAPIDEDGCMIGDSVGFNFDNDAEIKIYVNDKLSYDDSDLEYDKNYKTSYRGTYLFDKTECMGLWENIVHQEYYLNVENFDLSKLVCYFEEYDVPCDDSTEVASWITLKYDGKVIESDQESYSCENEDFCKIFVPEEFEKEPEVETENIDKVEIKKTIAEDQFAKLKLNEGALPGVFSVGKNKKICFSQGNLQFHAKKGEFRFAEYQWDCIGEANENISPNYDGWIDLFGWGTSGYKGCQPTKVSTNYVEYGPKSGDFKGANANYDWGVYNPVTNGGNKVGLWRTLKDSEWKFLIRKRENADKLCAQACVNGVNGLVILPDNFYELDVRVSFDSNPNDFTSNKYYAEVWTMLEDKGAVFIPAAGFRGSDISIGFVGTHGLVWSASDSNYVNYASYLFFNSDKVGVFDTTRYTGYAVRLVQDIE